MTEKTVATELGTEQIRKLLVQYAVPAIIAMTASSLYNIIDSIFIGQGVGAMAISGLAITFPFMNLSAAFGAMVGVGASTLISVRLGQKDYATAQHVLGNVVTLNIIIGVLFGAISLIFIDPILYFFGASEETIVYARDFMEVILWGNVITHMYLGLNAVLRASGHPRQSMYATITTVIINIILAPLFIYVFNWGIRGAALATIIAQTIALTWQIRLLSNPKELLHLRRGIYKLKKRIVADTLAIGMAPFLMNLTACLIVILINNSLKEYGGDFAIGAYGIANRVGFVFVMIIMGLNQGMQPIAGYNYGAQQYDRMMRVVKLTMIGATAVTTIGFLIGELAPEFVASLFTSDQQLIELAAQGLRYLVLVFPIVGFQMVAVNFFQSIGLASKAIFLSLTRQLIFLLPGLLLLPPLFDSWFGNGTLGVWTSMPLSDFLSTLLTIVLFRNQIKKFKAITPTQN